MAIAELPQIVDKTDIVSGNYDRFLQMHEQIAVLPDNVKNEFIFHDVSYFLTPLLMFGSKEIHTKLKQSENLTFSPAKIQLRLSAFQEAIDSLVKKPPKVDFAPAKKQISKFPALQAAFPAISAYVALLSDPTVENVQSARKVT